MTNMVGCSLMALSTQFRSYCVFKIEQYYKYRNLISIYGQISDHDKYHNFYIINAVICSKIRI